MPDGKTALSARGTEAFGTSGATENRSPQQATTGSAAAVGIGQALHLPTMNARRAFSLKRNIPDQIIGGTDMAADFFALWRGGLPSLARHAMYTA